VRTPPEGPLWGARRRMSTGAAARAALGWAGGGGVIGLAALTGSSRRLGGPWPNEPDAGRRAAKGACWGPWGAVAVLPGAGRGACEGAGRAKSEPTSRRPRAVWCAGQGCSLRDPGPIFADAPGGGLAMDLARSARRSGAPGSREARRRGVGGRAHRPDAERRKRSGRCLGAIGGGRRPTTAAGAPQAAQDRAQGWLPQGSAGPAARRWRWQARSGGRGRGGGGRAPGYRQAGALGALARRGALRLRGGRGIGRVGAPVRRGQRSEAHRPHARDARRGWRPDAAGQAQWRGKATPQPAPAQRACEFPQGAGREPAWRQTALGAWAPPRRRRGGLREVSTRRFDRRGRDGDQAPPQAEGAQPRRPARRRVGGREAARGWRLVRRQRSFGRAGLRRPA
jgi:hypothetical protein